MSIRVITVHLDGTPNDVTVLNGALALAAPFGGHIDTLFTRPDPRLKLASMEDGLYPSLHDQLVSALEQEWTATANKARKIFEKWKVAHEVRAAEGPDGDNTPSAAWRELRGSDTETLERRGRLSDVIVAALPKHRLETRYDLRFEAALLNTGRPVLLMPHNHHATSFVGEKAMIAWNGSIEATRAVTAALPLLSKCSEVLVFTAPEGTLTRDAAAELVAYLEWHGVQASILNGERTKSNTVEDALLAATRKAKAGLLVMGAYTHSRFRELLFGGVTRHVFGHATIPVLMAH